MLREALQQQVEERKVIGEFVTAAMVEGEDFGVIPGTKKKALLKPGAEKLTALFRCTPKFVIEKEIERFDDPGMVNAPPPFFFYRFRCVIESNDTGAVVSEGFGSCSSHEKKYRYRSTDRVCPSCGQPTIIKGKAEYGGGWLCFQKKGGCGAKWADGHPDIEGQKVGQEENPDAADVANTVLKMAKKRALVDAALALARCSDMFEQGEDALPQDRQPAKVPDQPPGETPFQTSARLKQSAAQALAVVTSRAGLEHVWGQVKADKSLFSEADWAVIQQMFKDVGQKYPAPTPKQEPTTQPGPVSVRDNLLDKLRQGGEKLFVEYQATFDQWAEQQLGAGVTLAGIAADPKWDGTKIAVALGKLNDWMKETIPE